MRTIRSILTTTPRDDIIAAYYAEWDMEPPTLIDWHAVIPIRTNAVAFIDPTPWENPKSERNMVNIEVAGEPISSLAFSLGELAAMEVRDRSGRLSVPELAAALLYEIGFHPNREDFQIDLEDLASRHG